METQPCVCVCVKGSLGSAECWECRLVLGVETATWCATVTARSSPKVATVTTVTTVTTVATAASTSTTIASEFATSAATSTASTSATTAAVTRVTRRVVLAVQGDTLLLLTNLLRLLGLATSASNEVLCLWVTSECLALWELLRGSLVWLADVQATAKCQTLLGLFGQVFVVGFGLLLWLGCGIFGSSAVWSVGKGWVLSAGIRCEASIVLDFGVGNGLAGLLVGPLGVAVFTSPTVSCLLSLLAVQWISNDQ